MASFFKLPEAVALALHASVIMAGEPDRPFTVKQIAGKMQASEAHFSKVLQRLVKAGLMKSLRGPKGGFILAVSPDRISLLQVYEALEGPVQPWDCQYHGVDCTLEREQCILGNVFYSFERDFKNYLENTTLRDVVLDEAANGVSGRVE